MEIDTAYFDEKKKKAKLLYEAQKSIYCPYFRSPVILNADGFHHLQFSSRRERGKLEQVLKFRLLSHALDVIKKSGTIQEYRKSLAPIGKKSTRDGAVPLKHVEYWAFVAIVGERLIKIRVILRRVGDGNIIFWSVMPDSKIRDGKQRLFSKDIEADE